MQTDLIARPQPPISLQQFCQQIGVTEVTAWRWRKRGWLRTLNIAGRVYVAAGEVAEFERRAAAGEFAKDHKAPARKAE